MPDAKKTCRVMSYQKIDPHRCIYKQRHVAKKKFEKKKAKRELGIRRRVRREKMKQAKNARRK